jgi:hypothetical protein
MLRFPKDRAPWLTARYLVFNPCYDASEIRPAFFSPSCHQLQATFKF